MYSRATVFGATRYSRICGQTILCSLLYRTCIRAGGLLVVPINTPNLEGWLGQERGDLLDRGPTLGLFQLKGQFTNFFILL